MEVQKPYQKVANRQTNKKWSPSFRDNRSYKELVHGSSNPKVQIKASDLTKVWLEYAWICCTYDKMNIPEAFTFIKESNLEDVV